MSFSNSKAFRVASLPRSRRAARPALGQHYFCLTRVGSLRVLFLVLALSAPAPAGAEILIEPRVGFRGVFQLGRPFPLEIKLANTGRPAEGMLEVQVWKGGAAKGGTPFLVHYRRELFLAAQSEKTVQLTVDPDFISRPLTIRFTGPSANAARELDLRRHFSPAPIVLLMSESSSLPFLASAASAQSRLISIAPAELAADARALLGVSHLLLYDQSLRELGRAQLLALDTWLSAGGKLVIFGSLNYALYQEPSLARFLPVRVIGAKRVAFASPAAKGAPPVKLSGVWAQVSAVVSGKALSESDGLPIIVEASRGRGRIVYLALDVGRQPLSQWDGLPKFLQTFLLPAGAEEAPLRTDWNDSVFAQLIASPSFISTYVPSASLFFSMLGYFAGIVLLSWLWQRRRLSPRASLVALVSFISTASVAGYVHFSQGGNIPDGVLLSSTVLESSGDGFVEAQANLALFSTQPRQYDLQLERGWIDLTPVTMRARESAQEAVVMQEAGGVSRYRLPLREWDYRLFRARHVERFPMHADFEAQGDKLIMSVDNRSAKDLTHCWLLMPGQRIDLGVIPRGARWRRVFPLAPPKLQGNEYQRPEMISFREVTLPDKTRDILLHSSFFPRDGDARLMGGAAVFFGWVKDPEPPVRVDDPRIQAQTYALYRAVVPLSAGEEE
jgi:hypothetical protein